MILKKKDMSGEYIQVKVSDEASWHEAIDRFIFFLQGCGYIVQGIDVAEYLIEQYAFQKPEPMPEEWVPKSRIKRKKGKSRAK